MVLRNVCFTLKGRNILEKLYISKFLYIKSYIVKKANDEIFLKIKKLNTPEETNLQLPRVKGRGRGKLGVWD